MDQKVNLGGISKIVNLHPIDLKFEEELHIWSSSTNTNYFLMSNSFDGFRKYCAVQFVILFVCQSPTGHNSKLIIMKLYQAVEVVTTEKPIDSSEK